MTSLTNERHSMEWVEVGEGPTLMYTLIHLGNNMYDLMPEPTRIRFTSPEQAKKFMQNITKGSAELSNKGDK